MHWVHLVSWSGSNVPVRKRILIYRLLLDKPELIRNSVVLKHRINKWRVNIKQTIIQRHCGSTGSGDEWRCTHRSECSHTQHRDTPTTPWAERVRLPDRTRPFPTQHSSIPLFMKYYKYGIKPMFWNPHLRYRLACKLRMFSRKSDNGLMARIYIELKSFWSRK